MYGRLVLAVDVGNSRTSLGLFSIGGELLHRWDVSNNYHTEDDLVSLIFPLFGMSGCGLREVKRVILASVVEPKKGVWRAFCEKYLSQEIHLIEHSHIKLIVNLYDKPAQLGIDRLINVFYAFKKYRKDCLVVDFGTATTFNYVNGRGEFCGGVILPGFGLLFRAIFENTNKLPLVEPWGFNEDLLCRDTNSAIINGISVGYIEMVKGLINKYKEILPKDTVIIGTGGLGGFFVSHCNCIDVFVPDLTLRGIFEVGKEYLDLNEGIAV